jgi:hypothetical protein
VPETFFGKCYDANLADLVVYFPPGGDATIRLVKGGKLIQQLRGERLAWALVFIADSTLVEAVADTLSTTTTWRVRDASWVARNWAVQDPQVLAARLQDSLHVRTVRRGRSRSMPSATMEDGLGLARVRRSFIRPEPPATTPPDHDTLAVRLLDAPGGLDHRTDLNVSDAGKHGENPVTDKSQQAPAPTYSVAIEDRTELTQEAATVRLETLAYQRGLGESAVVQGLAKLVGLPSTSGASNVPADSLGNLEVYELGRTPSPDRRPLYFAIRKLTLAECTVDRLRVRVGKMSVYRTFGNYSGSWLGASIGALGTWPKGGDPNLHSFVTNLYLLFHAYVQRPAQPTGYEPTHARVSVSLVLGTELQATTTPKNMFVGVSLGHLLGDLGLVAGVNARVESRAGGKEENYVRTRAAAGLNCAF